ncbi:MAG: tryptophan synthase subunit alpha [Clostridia bacterium]
MSDNLDNSRGLESIRDVFATTAAQDRAAFLPYFPVGYPDFETSLDMIEAMAEAGVDGFEIGIPFSDPLADGPTIQAATTRALRTGTTVARCFEGVAQLRHRGVEGPMLLMGYLNPLLSYGPQRFAADAREAGADGIIVPDLPPEERDILEKACGENDLALPTFLTPNTGRHRIKILCDRATGFIYVVSVTGVTGARDSLEMGLPGFLERAREFTEKPLVVGFGIATPRQARQVGAMADGLIVGSALVDAAARGVGAVRDLASRLRRALD